MQNLEALIRQQVMPIKRRAYVAVTLRLRNELDDAKSKMKLGFRLTKSLRPCAVYCSKQASFRSPESAIAVHL